MLLFFCSPPFNIIFSLTQSTIIHWTTSLQVLFIIMATFEEAGGGGGRGGGYIALLRSVDMSRWERRSFPTKHDMKIDYDQ